MYLQLTTRCNMSCEHCGFSCNAKGKDISLKDAKKAIDDAVEHEDSMTIGGGEPTLHPDFWEILAYAMQEGHKEIYPWVFLVTNGKRTEDALALAYLADNALIHVQLSQDDWHDPIDYKVVKAFNPKTTCNWTEQQYVPKSFAKACGYNETDWLVDAELREEEEAEYEEREPEEIDPDNLLESFWEMKQCEMMEHKNSYSYGLDVPQYKDYRTVTKIMARGRGKNFAGTIDECLCEGIVVAPDGVWQCGCKKLKLADDVWSEYYEATPNSTECSESSYFKEALENQMEYA